MNYPILQIALIDDSLFCTSLVIKQLSPTATISTNLSLVLVMTPNSVSAISNHR